MQFILRQGASDFRDPELIEQDGGSAHNEPVPLFDFRCRSCGAGFEALVRPAVAPACPSCASADLERLLSAFSFSVRSGGLSPAARRAVQKQQSSQRRDQAAFQEEIEKKHLDDD